MILIRGANVVDGTGRPPFIADVLIRGERISAVGNFPYHRTRITIDARDSILCPGFIDSGNESDHYLSLFSHPEQTDLLLQGITTIIGGHCGASLAPLLYGSLESVRKWAHASEVNVGWRGIRDFFRALERQKIGVNFGTLVGHATIRRALIGSDIRDLTDSELRAFGHIVEEAIQEGALGFSTGLEYAHASDAPYGEIKELARKVKKHGGVYATHMRNGREEILKSVDETIALARETGVATVISHLSPYIGFEKRFGSAVAKIESAAKNADISFEIAPSPMNIIPIYMLLPLWARNGDLDTMLQTITSRKYRDAVRDELPNVKSDEIVILRAVNARQLIGKTIGHFMESRELGEREALLQLMIRTRLRAVVLYKNINLDLAIQHIAHPHALIASHSPSLGNSHALLPHIFKYYLDFATSLRLMTLESAVKKITSVPAQKYNIRDRGTVKDGMYADLVLMKKGSVTDVFVNGAHVVQNGSCTNARNGKILRRL